MEASDYRIEEWKPGAVVLTLWSVLGIVLSVIGVFAFTVPYALARGQSVFDLQASVGLGGLMVTSAIFFLSLMLHEWVHGLAMRRFGGEPSYGRGMIYGILPYFYCTSTGTKFTKAQFTIVSAAPMVALSLIGALIVARVPYGGWFVVPLGLHLGGCIGDLWFLWEWSFASPAGRCSKT